MLDEQLTEISLPWVPTNPWSSPGTVVWALILTAEPKSPSFKQLPSAVKKMLAPV